MNFEELKVVWDSQNREPLYAISQTALHEIVRRRRDEEHQTTAVRHAVESIGNAVAGLATLVAAGWVAWGDPAWLATVSRVPAPLPYWTVAGLFLAGGTWLYCAGYMWSARQRQMRREENLGLSIGGDLERAIAHVGFQMRMAREIVWRGLIPAWSAAGLFVLVIFHLRQTPAWGYGVISLAMGGTFVAIYRWQHYAIRKLYEPRRRDLESLRAKLISDGG